MIILQMRLVGCHWIHKRQSNKLFPVVPSDNKGSVTPSIGRSMEKQTTAFMSTNVSFSQEAHFAKPWGSARPSHHCLPQNKEPVKRICVESFSVDNGPRQATNILFGQRDKLAVVGSQNTAANRKHYGQWMLPGANSSVLLSTKR